MAGLSQRELGRRTGKSHVAIARWEEGKGRTAPVEVLEQAEALAMDAFRSVAELVASRPGLTPTELDRLIEDPTKRRLVHREIAPGGRFELRFMETIDRRGRHYSRAGVFLVGAPVTAEQRRRPENLNGDELRAQLSEVGISPAELAARLGVAPSTVRLWVAGLRRIPPGRRSDLDAELAWPQAEDIRTLRQAAGWSLKELGDRVGVTLSVVHRWEGRKSPVPAARRPALRSVLREARESPRPDPVEREIEQQVNFVRAHQGVTRKELLHSRRERRGRRQIASQRAATALDIALARGTLVERDAMTLTAAGHPGTHTGIYTPDAGPTVLPLEPFTGVQLRERRKEACMSQRELAERAGTTGEMVGFFERRGTRAVPAHWAAVLLDVFAAASRGPSKLDLAKATILRELVANPGIARWRLEKLSDTGTPKTFKRALEQLLQERRVELGDAFDSQGRPYRGLFLAGMTAGERPRALTTTEMRDRLAASGWHQDQLAAALGVATSTTSRWVSGTRQLSPGTSARVLAVIAEKPPRDLSEDRRRNRLIQLVARGGADGISPSELIAPFGTAGARELLERGIAEGLVHPEDVVTRDRRGRPYVRRRLVLGRSPENGATGPPAMTGAELRAARARSGFSQDELARRLGVSQARVSHWETAPASSIPAGRVSELRAALADELDQPQTGRGRVQS
jgi:transcriptional regulator with XRE-family HTH domain